MQVPSVGHRKIEPKRRRRHYSYDESVNEAAKLINDEPVDVEHEVPAEENPSEQGVEPQDKSSSPPFEE